MELIINPGQIVAIIAALLVAVYIISDRFLSFNSQLVTINLSFIPALITAILLGPFYGMLVFGLTDYIGAHLFPFGEYFPRFIFSSILTGFVYGLFLCPGFKERFLETRIGTTKVGKKLAIVLLEENANLKRFIINLVFSTLIVTIGIKIFLQAFWLNLLYGKAYFIIIQTRIVTQIIMFFIQMIVGPAIYKMLQKEINKYLMED